MAGKTRALSIVRNKAELVEEVKQNLPQFLVMHCQSCDRDTRVNGLEITKDIDRSGEVPALVLKGSCKKCGKEMLERFGTTDERRQIALRTERYWERESRRREKRQMKKANSASSREKPTVAKTATKTKKADKAVEKTKKVKATAKAAEKTTKAAKGAKSEKKAKGEGTTRQAVYVRGEGLPTQQQAFIMVAGGGLRTVEDINDRWNKAAKKGLVGDRTRPVETKDLTFMCGERAGKIEIDGKEHEMWMGKDPESDTILYGSTYKDILGSGKPIRVKNGKVGKIQVAKAKKDLK